MMPLAKSSQIRRALLLATGQITSYGSGAGVDDGALQIGELHRYTVLTTDQYAGSVNIALNGKTDVHSNACVFDEATGLMWSRTLSASVGPTSNGLLPWTTNGSGEGIFPYAAAANAALLAGYSDWRIPNKFELFSLVKSGEISAAPDTDAFPSIGNQAVITSSSISSLGDSYTIYVYFLYGVATAVLKTATHKVMLVRGPS